MLIPVIVHAIRVTRFPKKIKRKPCIHEKFSFFLLVGSLHKRLKNLTMFLALTMLIPVIVHAIRVTYFPEKSSVNLCTYEKFSFFLLVGSLHKRLKNLTMFLVPAMLLSVIIHAIRVTRFPEKIKCKPHIHEKFSFFLLAGSLYKRLKNLTMFLDLTMLIPVIVHAIRVTCFPEKIKCKPHIHEKFLFFLLVGSLYKRLKNLPMFLVPAMLLSVIIHAIRVTCFPEKSSANLCIHENFSFFLLAGSLYKRLKNLLTGNIFLVIIFWMPLHAPHKRFLRQPYAFN